MSSPPNYRSNNEKRRRGKPSETSPYTSPVKQEHEASTPGITVLVTRVELYDSGRSKSDESHTLSNYSDVACPDVASYSYDTESYPEQTSGPAVIYRVPRTKQPEQSHFWMETEVVDNSTPCPLPNVTKYWKQRRRLFSKFDEGIELDEEGWFSVTPEQIAYRVAHEIQKHYSPQVVLDAFCGCGGNAIAFATVSHVVALDVDRHKLKRTAHNARIYGIPPERILLIECNALFVLEYCYRNGKFVLDEPLESPEKVEALMAAMPPPVATEVYEGFQIGGIDLLPRSIGAIFMDPPWGGVDYEVFGKHGYDLEHNMKIERPSRGSTTVQDDFFDSFATTRNKQDRKAQFNCSVDDSNCVNGAELLKIAAAAAQCVLYDVPRNTRLQSLGNAALAAGYRGNCKWEEHYLNGRLKTVTAYFGKDWSSLMSSQED